MWITVIAFIICLLVVYTLRRQAMDYAWKVATAAGVVVNIVVIAVSYTHLMPDFTRGYGFWKDFYDGKCDSAITEADTCHRS